MSHFGPESPDVLVVEDEETVRRATSRVLEREGLRTGEATDVPSAVAQLETRSYRLALTDLMLPGESGLELISWARKRQLRTPMVAITGYATIANALDSFRLGAFDFIPKPFDVGELLAVVRRGLRCFDLSAAPFTAPQVDAGGPSLHLLGAHSFATLDVDGSATFGIGASLSSLVGEVMRIELPSPGERVGQARCCLRIHSGDRLTHRVWAPLSGKVVAVNPELSDNPKLLIADAYGRGWACRVLPDNLMQELPALTPASTAGAPVGAGRR